jgi:RimJ/RimL family protein N-acetyltransferase
MLTLQNTTLLELKPVILSADKYFLRSKSSADKNIYKVSEEFSIKPKFASYKAINEAKKFIGFILVYPSDKYDVAIGAMFILPEFRGRGYAKQMIQLLIDHYKQQSAKTFYTRTWLKNNASLKTFISLNFQIIETIPNERIDNDTTVKLLLTLR